MTGWEAHASEEVKRERLAVPLTPGDGDACPVSQTLGTVRFLDGPDLYTKLPLHQWSQTPAHCTGKNETLNPGFVSYPSQRSSAERVPRYPQPGGKVAGLKELEPLTLFLLILQRSRRGVVGILRLHGLLKAGPDVSSQGVS